MKKNLHFCFATFVLFLTANIFAIDVFGRDIDPKLPTKPKSNNHPLPKRKPLPVKFGVIAETYPWVKTVREDGKDKEVKYVEDNAVVDCIRYEITTDKKLVKTGEETEIKVRMEFVSQLPLMWRDEDCQKLALKVVFPKGFVQTGGDYYDFVNVSFDENNKVKELMVQELKY